MVAVLPMFAPIVVPAEPSTLTHAPLLGSDIVAVTGYTPGASQIVWSLPVLVD